MSGAQDLAQYPQFELQYSAASSFATPVTIAHADSFQVNDQYNVQTVADFDTALGQIADRILQERTINVNIGVNIMLSDAGFKALMGAAKNATYSYFGLTMADTNSSPASAHLYLGGYYSQRSFQGQMPVAKASVVFDASEVISDTFNL